MQQKGGSRLERKAAEAGGKENPQEERGICDRMHLHAAKQPRVRGSEPEWPTSLAGFLRLSMARHAFLMTATDPHTFDSTPWPKANILHQWRAGSFSRSINQQSDRSQVLRYSWLMASLLDFFSFLSFPASTQYAVHRLVNHLCLPKYLDTYIAYVCTYLT